LFTVVVCYDFSPPIGAESSTVSHSGSFDIELVDETPLFLDGVFAELMSERAVAAAEVLDNEMLPEEEEGEDVEDNDGFEV
jgi:hypothetical protein